MLELFHKLATPFYILATLAWSVVLNIILVPLSFLYSVCTKTLSSGWKLLQEKDPYVLYWSIRKAAPMLFKDGRSATVVTLGKHPQALLALFAVAVPLICICAGITHLVHSVGADAIEAEEQSEKPKKTR